MNIISFSSSLKILLLCLPAFAVTAGTFADRDNELVATDDAIARSMVLIWTEGGDQSSGMQVCPGVFLANAHGIYDDTSDEPPQRFSIVPYSFENGTKYTSLIGVYSKDVEIIGSQRYISDDLGVNGADYVFLRTSPENVDRSFRSLGSDVRSFDFVSLLNISGELLSNVSDAGDVDVHFYRRGNYKRDKYSFPVRTVQRCSIAAINDYNIGFDCPAGGGISGSSLISRIQDRPFIVGLFWGGRSPNIFKQNTFEQHLDRHLAIETSHLCKDYETACGRPCVEPSEISGINIEYDREAVAELQTFLTEQGYDVGPIDGIYGSKSASGLTTFQKENAIQGNGFTVEIQQLIRGLD